MFTVNLLVENLYLPLNDPARVIVKSHFYKTRKAAEKRFNKYVDMLQRHNLSGRVLLLMEDGRLTKRYIRRRAAADVFA